VKKFGRHILIKILIYLALFLSVEYVLYRIYQNRILEFGCFDDCYNYGAGYFLVQGKKLYTELAFGHNMLMAYASAVIQSIHIPVNIYEFILIHRRVLFLYGLIMDLLIILRFRAAGAGFMLLYEFSKFYLFGDRFLAEGAIVYPLVYMTGVLMDAFRKRLPSAIDYVLCGIFCWFIIFMREPFVPISIVLYALIIAQKSKRLPKMISVIIFCLLTALILITVNIPEYVYDIVVLNRGLLTPTGTPTELAVNLLKQFLYPLFLFIGGQWNEFRSFIIGLDIVFLIAFILHFKAKFEKQTLMLLTLLGLANFRFTEPGTIFYSAYHMLPWFGMFYFTLCYMVFRIWESNRKIGALLVAVAAISFFLFLSSKSHFMHFQPNLQSSLLTHYGTYLSVGETVRNLSEPKDTLFLDGADELIYWQAQRLSPYTYSWYTGTMPSVLKYRTARIAMFTNSPPDFYYDFCSKDAPLKPSLPPSVMKDYQQLYLYGKPSCLYVRIMKLTSINDAQWAKAAEMGYGLPPIYGTR